MTWEPTWKAEPPCAQLTKYLLSLGVKPTLAKAKSCFNVFPYELSTFAFLVRHVHLYGEQWSQGVLWPHYTRYARDPWNKMFSGWALDRYEAIVGPQLPHGVGYKRIVTGRLGCSLGGAGKRRVFAIGNYVNQRLLRPVHKWLGAVLRRLPTFGTYWQTRPLDRLQGKHVCYSYDLKSATDRWPLYFLFRIVLFDRSCASSAVNSALACNIFHVPFVSHGEFCCGTALR